MPAKQIYIRYRDEIAAKLQDAFADKNVQKVLLLFEGSTDINTGDSWDETCREVESLLEPHLNTASEKTLFLMTEVGSKEAWKDEANFFRKHTTYKLTSIPTLLQLSGPETVIKRLEGLACLDENALTELFG